MYYWLYRVTKAKLTVKSYGTAFNANPNTINDFSITCCKFGSNSALLCVGHSGGITTVVAAISGDTVALSTPVLQSATPPNSCVRVAQLAAEKALVVFRPTAASVDCNAAVLYMNSGVVAIGSAVNVNGANAATFLGVVAISATEAVVGWGSSTTQSAGNNEYLRKLTITGNTVDVNGSAVTAITQAAKDPNNYNLGGVLVHNGVKCFSRVCTLYSGGTKGWISAFNASSLTVVGSATAGGSTGTYGGDVETVGDGTGKWIASSYQMNTNALKAGYWDPSYTSDIVNAKTVLHEVVGGSNGQVFERVAYHQGLKTLVVFAITSSMLGYVGAGLTGGSDFNIPDVWAGIAKQDAVAGGSLPVVFEGVAPTKVAYQVGSKQNQADIVGQALSASVVGAVISPSEILITNGLSKR